MTSWKTTLGGIIAAVAALGPIVHMMTTEQSVALLGVAAAWGLIAAKDSNVTGGTKKQ